MGADVYVCYSLPRLVSPAMQCSFCAYMWELYTGEFGWSAAEYGTISSWFYSGTQIIAFLVLGLIFKFAIEGLGGDIKAKLNWSKGILAGGTSIHWLTYFLLIFLPIKWHGVKTPYVDSLFDRQSWFFKGMFTGPVPLSSMAGTWFWWIIFGFPWCFVKFFWILFYPFMRLFWILIPMNYAAVVSITSTMRKSARMFFGIMYTLFRALVCILTLPISLPWYAIDMSVKRLRKRKILPVLESIPPPTCSACCNTTCCNNFAMRLTSWKTFMGTRTFRLYMITIVHSVGMAMHELSNKVLEGYVGMDSINWNLSFFFGSNIVVYFIFSFVKSYLHSKAAFSETFYMLSILFFVLWIPILPTFIVKTTGTGTSQGIPDPGLSVICLFFKFLSATTFHGTIVFLIFSGGPLISYVGGAILGGHKVLMSFGVLVLFGALNCTSWIHMAITTFNPTAAGKAFGDPITQMSIAGGCIVLQSFTFTLFFKHDWQWNIGNWFNYLLFIFTGAVNAIFVTYANIMQSGVTGDARCRDWAWLYHGAFYSGTNVVVTFSMLRMFGSFAYNETRQCGCKCFPISYQYNFPSVYKKLTGLFIFANIIAFGVYVLGYFLDQLAAAAAKLVDSAKNLVTAATAFDAVASEGDDDKKLETFRAASAALEAAGQALLGFAKELERPKNKNIFTKVKTHLVAAANKFREASGPTGNAGETTDTGFQNVVKALREASVNHTSGFNAALQDKFGKNDSADTTSAAAKFKSFVTASTSATAEQFKQAAEVFQSAATAFNTKAKEQQTETDKSNLGTGNIHTNFKNAAETFGKVANDATKGAAIKLFDDIKNQLLLAL